MGYLIFFIQAQFSRCFATFSYKKERVIAKAILALRGGSNVALPVRFDHQTLGSWGRHHQGTVELGAPIFWFKDHGQFMQELGIVAGIGGIWS